MKKLKKGDRFKLVNFCAEGEGTIISEWLPGFYEVRMDDQIIPQGYCMGNGRDTTIMKEYLEGIDLSSKGDSK